jgi:hypothetical protein
VRIMPETGRNHCPPAAKVIPIVDTAAQSSGSRDWQPSPSGGPVPAQFLGQSRLLEQQVAAAHEVAFATVKGRVMPLVKRWFAPQSNPRPVLLLRAKETWETEVPAIGRLARHCRLGKTSLFVGEFRLAPMSFHLPNWLPIAPDKNGISIVTFVLNVTPNDMELLRMAAIAFVGRHALSRWFQRALSPITEQLYGYLRRLTMSAAQVLAAANEEFEVGTDNGGAWRGSLIPNPSGDEALLRVRSFY